MDWKKQGTALVSKQAGYHHEHEIQETEDGRYALRVDGTVIFFL